jgi:hypothetical protein
MPRNPPRLFRSGLTGRVYAVTNYVEDDRGNVVAMGAKTDVTRDFEAIEAARAAERAEADTDATS